jgi:hypothetical protein
MRARPPANEPYEAPEATEIASDEAVATCAMIGPGTNIP